MKLARERCARRALGRGIAALILVACVACFARRAVADPLALLVQEGDLVFHRSRSPQAEAVALATNSNLTHMGVVLFESGAFWVYEAVQPVRRTPLGEWVARGEKGRVLIRRLRDANTVLRPSVLKELRRVLHSFVGRPYDLQFRWDDEQLYCSELVYKAYERAAGVRIGRLQRAGDMNLASPVVQKKLRERYGKKLGAFDREQPVITPQSMYDDESLVTVYAN